MSSMQSRQRIKKVYGERIPPTLKLWRDEGGGDVPKLEPKRLNFRSVDKIVRNLRRIYKENPALFDVPTFARKIY